MGTGSAPGDSPAIDWFEFWADDWFSGAASDGLHEYFDKWFAWMATQGDPEFERFSNGGSEVSAWKRKTFFGDEEEYVLLDRDGANGRSGARLRYMALTDEETGQETTWSFLEGMTDLGEAWRRDLIESFRGDPGYAAVKDTVTRYWRNEYEPQLIMQVDAATLEFFFVPRGQGAGGETTT